VRNDGAQVLFLEVRPSNAAGLKLYARHGFRRIGVRRDYYPAQGGRENALVFALEF
jgi:ribosomal-protein-alanine N-acetyltransferase